MVFVVLTKKGSSKSIQFHAVEAYHFKSLSKGQAEFTCRTEIKQGEFPIGSNINGLNDFIEIKLQLPFISSLTSRVKDGQIIINGVDLELIINGNLRARFNPPTGNGIAEIKSFENDRIHDWILIEFDIQGDLVGLFQGI